jgi:hypothetical protein
MSCRGGGEPSLTSVSSIGEGKGEGPMSPPPDNRVFRQRLKATRDRNDYGHSGVFGIFLGMAQSRETDQQSTSRI